MVERPDRQIGVVVIGRNEGERLKRCLRSLVDASDGIVYVDSGSTDGSPAFARSLGVDVVDLDMSRPFTMPRGRNEGFERLREIRPGVDYVQFVDGDCTVEEGWIEAAADMLDERGDVAVVCGRRRERYPDVSIYNRMCDSEWDGPKGEVAACGGDALMRSRVFAGAGGFDASMIAGEEAELCLRIRREGWKVLRIDRDMTLHDADIHRFDQWWNRCVRTGHAYAEGAAMHGAGPERHGVRAVRSVLVHGIALPVVMVAGLALALGVHVAFWCVPAAVALFELRLWWTVRRSLVAKGVAGADANVHASFAVLGKLAQAVGVSTYWANRLRGRRTGLLEYKQPAPEGGAGR